MSVKFFISIPPRIMLQAQLLSQSSYKSIAIEGIRASILQQNDNSYEILLEVNSNKIMIAMEGDINMIESFEIIAIRGFIELTTNFIKTIKKLIQHLLYRLD